MADVSIAPVGVPETPDVDVPARRTLVRRARMLALVNLGVDLVAVTGGYLLSKGIIVSARDGAAATTRSAFSLGGRWVLLTVPLWLVIFAAYGLYDRHELDAPSEEMRRLFHGITVSLVAVVMVTFWAKFAVSRGWIASLALFCTLTVAFGRVLVRRLGARLSSNGYLVSPALIVGTNEEARTIARSLQRQRQLGYRAVGFVTLGPMPMSNVDGLPVVGSVDDIAVLARQTGVAAVIIAGTAVRADVLLQMDAALQAVDVEIRLTPGLPHVSPSRITVRPLDGLALLSLDRRELGVRQAALKRTFDVIGSTVLFVLALPLMVGVGLLVRLTSRGPALFRQERVGKGGRPFQMYKFRSMVVGAEELHEELVQKSGADTVLFKLREDPRVTRIGRVLRRWAIDELPQLWNVVKGDMSLVGPRPALPGETARYTHRLRTRLRVKPGLTGLWQVNGRHELPFADYIRYDLFYVENWSLGLDLYVIGKTVPALLGRRGSY
ncbi:MAG: Exopolysaccharide biosynthesis polyprenyl glycosylphosphotransferase [Acidimicrobiales bacterium]|nr:Exopolysaccharide biosynthesis polyprenyl glycosylphosphotransferase [Acidimicrobiales bacterium]